MWGRSSPSHAGLWDMGGGPPCHTQADRMWGVVLPITHGLTGYGGAVLPITRGFTGCGGRSSLSHAGLRGCGGWSPHHTQAYGMWGAVPPSHAGLRDVGDVGADLLHPHGAPSLSTLELWLYTKGGCSPLPLGRPGALGWPSQPLCQRV